jgi:hypothetical protein
MTITLKWDNPEETILIIQYEKPWTWAEFSRAYEDMFTYLNSVKHPVDMVFDIRNGGFPPPGAITRFRQVGQTEHPNGRRLVFVAPKLLSQFVNSTLDILKIAYLGAFQSPKFLFVTSLEEARILLSEQKAQKSS